jgi:hypothetical protein
MTNVENVLVVSCFALIMTVVVAQAGGLEPTSLGQLIQILLEFLSEFASLFDILFGDGFLSG